MKFHKSIFFAPLIIAILCFSAEQSVAQRYSHENTLGGIENVKFFAHRNGGIIEFDWDIRTTREIVSIEVMRGEEDQSEIIQWELLKKLEASENTFVDYDPKSGKMHYKLVLVGKDG